VKKTPRLECDDLLGRLADSEIVPPAAETWEDLSAEFRIVEEIPTGLSGQMWDG
jgi:hypothetical protein